jgi:hypothetical protein
LKILKENNVPFSNLFSLVKKVIFSELLLLWLLWCILKLLFIDKDLFFSLVKFALFTFIFSGFVIFLISILLLLVILLIIIFFLITK